MQHSGVADLSADLITEVELSAEDLLGLSPSCAAGFSRSNAERSSSAKPPRKVAAKVQHDPQSSVPERFSRSRIVGLLALAIIAAVVVGARFESAAPRRVVQFPVSAWTPIPAHPSTDRAEEQPTLFANPFDENEVFELPPGLSSEEARRMVADLLIKRAGERAAR